MRSRNVFLLAMVLLIPSITFSQSPVSTGLVKHVDADAITGLNDGDPVAAWTDLSTVANNPAQSDVPRRPTYTTGVINGMPVVRFDGYDDYLIARDASKDLFNGDQPFTVFMVTSVNGYGNGGHSNGAYGLGAGSSGTRHVTMLTFESATVTGNRLWGGNPKCTTSDIALNTPVIVENSYSGGGLTEYALYFNGVEKTITNTNANKHAFNASSIVLGTAPEGKIQAPGGVYHYNGDIAEILVFNRSLTQAERDAVGGHLSGKWGIASDYPDYTPPAQIVSPADGQDRVALDSSLQWNTAETQLGSGIANPDITKHLVYMSDGSPTDPNLTLVATIDTGSDPIEFDPDGDLKRDAVYYWRVDERLSSDEDVITGSVSSFETLPSTPMIDIEPVKKMVYAGEEAQFSVVATNPYSVDDTGLSYEWRKLGSDDVIGDQPNLIIDDVQAGDSGTFFCTVIITDPAEGAGNSTETAEVRLFVKRLLGHWNFEDNMDDASGNGYHGSLVGTPAYDSPEDPSRAVTGKSLECILDSGNYAEVPAAVLDDVDTEISISLWTRGVGQPNAGDQSTLVAMTDTDQVVINLMIPEDTARVQIDLGNPDTGTNQIRVSAANSWFNGKWNHWVITKDSDAGQMQIFVNGILWQSSNAGHAVYGATKFYIGGGRNGTFGGFIDDVRVFNYVLNEEQIAEISPRPMLPSPSDNSLDITFDTDISWTPGDDATKFKVYYGTELDDDPNVWLTDPAVIDSAVAQANPGLNLDLGAQYYWYVEEYNDLDELLWTSDLWDFTVRILHADADGSSNVGLDDIALVAARWLDDVRDTPTGRIIDTCSYDPNNTDPDDPTSYAHYWDTYYTMTLNDTGTPNLLYGDGVCTSVEDPNGNVIAWRYDTPSSTGKTDTDFIYWHRDREKLPLNQYDEFHMEVKALPGSSLKNPWFGFNDKDGDGVSYVLPVGILGDNEWHDLVIPLSTLGGIEDMDDFEYIHAGIWGSNQSGTWYIKNLRVVNNAGTLQCIPEYYIPEDMNNDCLVNIQDLAVAADEWMLDARNP